MEHSRSPASRQFFASPPSKRFQAPVKMSADASNAHGGPGNTERIRIFLRLRPVARQTGRVVWGAAEEPPWVEFNVPRNPAEG